MKRYIKKIIVPFVTQKRKALKLEASYPAVTIFDGFQGQTTNDIRALLNAHNIIPMQLPPNCTNKLQPLDVSINKPIKDHMKATFQQWYANEVRKQLEQFLSVKSKWMLACLLLKVLVQTGLFRVAILTTKTGHSQ